MPLNFDMLHAVPSHLQLWDLLHMMHTCRTLYGLGIPLLLRDISFIYHGRVPSELHLYHDFLSDAERFKYVRRVACYHKERSSRLVWDDDDAAPANLFPVFISLGNNIRHFDICFCSAAAVTADEIAQIALLPNLRSLRLYG